MHATWLGAHVQILLAVETRSSSLRHPASSSMDLSQQRRRALEAADVIRAQRHAETTRLRCVPSPVIEPSITSPGRSQRS
jgi:hypothetical protein